MTNPWACIARAGTDRAEGRCASVCPHLAGARAAAARRVLAELSREARGAAYRIFRCSAAVPGLPHGLGQLFFTAYTQGPARRGLPPVPKTAANLTVWFRFTNM